MPFLIEEKRLTSPTSSAQVSAVIGPTAFGESEAVERFRDIEARRNRLRGVPSADPPGLSNYHNGDQRAICAEKLARMGVMEQGVASTGHLSFLRAIVENRRVTLCTLLRILRGGSLLGSPAHRTCGYFVPSYLANGYSLQME
jgi:hypothetical protein